MGRRYRIVIINFKSGEIMFRNGRVDKQQTGVWNLKIFKTGLIDLLLGKKEDIVLPLPPANYLHGRVYNTKKDFLVLGTNDNVSYYYVTKDDKDLAKIKPLNQDLLRWVISSQREVMNKYETKSNWEKLAPYFVMALLAAVLLIGFMMQSDGAKALAGAKAVCKCLFNVTAGIPPA